jgi:hypothetical protein
MTKEEILNGMSEQEFYDMYPDQESWENAQQMKLGGLSGAPHDGQPTADQFFNYGSHANDAVNVPMSNPFFAANGGTPYYGGPVRPYAYGGGLPKAQEGEQVPYIEKFKIPNSNNYTGDLYFENNGEKIQVPFKHAVDFNHKKIALKLNDLYNGAVGRGLDYNPDAAKGAFEVAKQMRNEMNTKPNFDYNKYQNKVDSLYNVYPPDGGFEYGGYMDDGGNAASPMNYGAFNVPMQSGGVLDPGNNQQYPILEDGGKANLMAMIKAHSKKMKNDYKKEGGDTVMQGGNSNNYPDEIKTKFIKGLKQNLYNHMVNEEEQTFANEFMQMGGYQGQGMNYNTTTFNEEDPQNAAIRDMYKQRIAHYDNDFQNNMGNLSNAMYNLKATANPYTQTTVKAQDGVQVLLNKQTGKPFTEDEYSQYEKYFGKKNQSQPFVNTQQSQNINPSYNLKRINHRHFGPWGRTDMTFGYRDQAPLLGKNENIKDYTYTPGAESNQTTAFTPTQNMNQGNDPYADHMYNPYNPATDTPNSTESWFDKMRGVKNDRRNEQEESWIDKYRNNRARKADQRQDATILKNRLKREAEQDKAVGPYVSPEEGMAYGGLTRAQYGKNHLSTNPSDGTYDANGNLVNASSTAGNTSLTSNPMITSNSFQPTSNAPGAAPAGTAAGVTAATTNKQTSSNPTSFQSGWNYAGPSYGTFDGKPIELTQSMQTPQSAGIAQTPITMTGVQAPKVVPEENKIGSPMGPEKEATITSKQKPGYNGMAAAATIVAGIDTATSAINKAKDKSKGKLAELQLADNAYLANPSNAQSQGDYDPNSGMFRPNQMVPVQFAGYSAYGGSFQEGDAPDQAQPDPQQVMEGVAQMLQQGAQPEQVAQQLVQMGIPQEQVMQIIQVVMQQLQGGQQEQQPAMRYGGYAMGGSPDDEDEESYEDDLDEDEIAELKRQGYNVEYI